MGNRIHIIIFFLLLFPIIATAQNADYQNLVKQWDKFRNSSDNEKDYRSASFLTLLEETLRQGISGHRDTGVLPGWKSDTSSDNRFVAHAAYVSFDIRPDQIFYCLYDRENEEGFSFSRELRKKYSNRTVTPRFEMIMPGEVPFHAINFVSDKDVVINLPDVETALLLEKLSRSRGGEYAFDVSALLQLRLEELMKLPGLFENNFSGFARLSTLMSSDDVLKIVTWNVEDIHGVHHHFGLTAVNMDDEIRTFRLIDQSEDIQTPEFSTLNTSEWYGAVYYEIIEEKYRGDVFYTLLGYDGNNAFSRIRVVDVLTLSNKGIPKFGAPVFDINGRIKLRLIFEHSNRANMMLRYDDNNDLIVMDHLAPMEPAYEGDRSYYGPDFSYDALEFKKGKWNLLENIELRNR